MGFLKELNSMPKVMVDNIKYVPEETYKKYLADRLEAEKDDTMSQYEIDGIDNAICVVLNS